MCIPCSFPSVGKNGLIIKKLNNGTCSVSRPIDTPLLLIRPSYIRLKDTPFIWPGTVRHIFELDWLSYSLTAKGLLYIAV